MTEAKRRRDRPRANVKCGLTASATSAHVFKLRAQIGFDRRLVHQRGEKKKRSPSNRVKLASPKRYNLDRLRFSPAEPGEPNREYWKPRTRCEIGTRENFIK